MESIYIIGGLGVDRRVFEDIDLEQRKVAFIEWLLPFKEESLAHYATRISDQIHGEHIVLIGLSFGGILAVEISKIKKIDRIILIASAKNKFEIPGIYRLMGKLNLHKIIPVTFFKTPHSLTHWFFGIRSRKEKELLRSILRETDPVLLQWSINAILGWKHSVMPKNCIHIHGDSDRILPVNHIRADYIIRNGGHFMTVNQAKK